MTAPLGKQAVKYVSASFLTDGIAAGRQTHFFISSAEERKEGMWAFSATAQARVEGKVSKVTRRPPRSTLAEP